MSRTSLIVPFYRCAVVATISEHQWELSSVVVDIQLFCVLSDILISWSAGIRMEWMWPKAFHRQIHAKQLLVGAWVSYIAAFSRCSYILLYWIHRAISTMSPQYFWRQTQRTGDTCVGVWHQQQLHLFSAAIAIVLYYVQRTGDTCVGAWHHCLLLGVQAYTYWLRKKWAGSVCNWLSSSRPWGWLSQEGAAI